jgi:opacity protein-like surface antigen
MKKRFLKCMAIAALTVLLSFGSVFAADQNTGFYVGVTGAYVIPQTMTVSDPDNSANYMDTTLDNGYLFGIKGGWNTPFTKQILALEMEYNYIFGTGFDNAKVIPDFMGEGPGTLDATISIHAFLFNAKARYPEGKIHPYAGFGIGWALFEVGDFTAISALDPADRITSSGKSGNAFCWQLLAGVDFDITPNLGVGVGYKYFATKPTVGDNNGEGMYAEFDYRASIITLGLTYTF